MQWNCIKMGTYKKSHRRIPQATLIWSERAGRQWHTFSAFWLRSSVVSVLISLISGTSTKVDMMIKWLYEALGWPARRTPQGSDGLHISVGPLQLYHWCKITQDFFRTTAEKVGQILAFWNFDFTKFLSFWNFPCDFSTKIFWKISHVISVLKFFNPNSTRRRAGCTVQIYAPHHWKITLNQFWKNL